MGVNLRFEMGVYNRWWKNTMSIDAAPTLRDVYHFIEEVVLYFQHTKSTLSSNMSGWLPLDVSGKKLKAPSSDTMVWKYMLPIREAAHRLGCGKSIESGIGPGSSIEHSVF